MAKNKGSENTTGAALDESQYTEDENLGFPPYWNPSEGGKFAATVITLDDGDPDFKWWVFRSCTRSRVPIPAAKGEDGSEPEKVLVKKGEFFSTSDYVQFRLHQYVGLEVMIYVKGGKVKIAGGKTMWSMGMRVSTAVKELLNKRRMSNRWGPAFPWRRWVAPPPTA